MGSPHVARHWASEGPNAESRLESFQTGVTNRMAEFAEVMTDEEINLEGKGVLSSYPLREWNAR